MKPALEFPLRVEPLDLHELVEGGTGIKLVDADGVVVADNQTYYPEELDARHAEQLVWASNVVLAAQMLEAELVRLYGFAGYRSDARTNLQQALAKLKAAG